MNSDSIRYYENKEMCAQCGGECCKRYPGIAEPKDFGDSEQEIKSELLKAINSGRWTFDYWEGGTDGMTGDRAYFVRPAVKGLEGSVVDPTWGGPCTFHGNNGCELEIQKRPNQCRMLEPKGDYNSCEFHGVYKKDLVKLWLPYGKIIDEIIQIIEKSEGGEQ